MHFCLVSQMSWWHEATLSALGRLQKDEGENIVWIKWGHQKLEKHTQIRAVFK